MMRATTWLRAAGTTLIATACIWDHAGAQQSADATRIKRDIEVLAHDRWEGRATCTPGIDSAAGYIAKRFADLKLAPAGSRDSATGRIGFMHRYTARPSGGQAHYGVNACAAQNVAGIVRGTDAALANEFVIVGAHYDHLGRSLVGSRGTVLGDLIHNGADDNASGTAAVLELARLISEQPLRRSVLFVTFSGEEWGLLGSADFVRTNMPAGRVQAMLNFDMVGRLKDDRLLVFGVGTASELAGIVAAQNNGPHAFKLGTNPDGAGPSDHASFYADTIPVLHFFTDYHFEYHKTTDAAALINAPGEARVVEYALRVARDVADRAPLTFVAQTRAQSTASSSGERPYLGSLPDMAASDAPGLRLSGVTPGSPGDAGGLKANDLVVEFGGKPVTDLQSYSDALNAHKPGDTVRIVVVRNGERVTVTVKLGRRQ
ncbi:MAG TPA: M28 family peptidase [Gemmatimonadaceae bacterium]|nr:M28 family peptidase [Gemmatimonadaceae bacterium]